MVVCPTGNVIAEERNGEEWPRRKITDGKIK